MIKSKYMSLAMMQMLMVMGGTTSNPFYHSGNADYPLNSGINTNKQLQQWEEEDKNKKLRRKKNKNKHKKF